jgi:nucleotide-binding universal stress UspA family protein
VDQNPLSSRVVYHAAGLASAARAKLILLTVTAQAPTRDDELTLERLYLNTVPYGASYLSDPAITVERGTAVDAIVEAARPGVDLIVVGSRGRGLLSRALLGSTSTALLERTTRPVLLVPPQDLDIVTLGPTHVALHVGAVLAAVDLNEINEAQLTMAAAMASLTKQPWELLTIAGDELSDHAAAHALRDRARHHDPPPQAVIVRRGHVAEEIGRAAVAERSGLVVMGLRARDRGTPGEVASAVLRTGRAFVMAVPAA